MGAGGTKRWGECLGGERRGGAEPLCGRSSRLPRCVELHLFRTGPFAGLAFYFSVRFRPRSHLTVQKNLRMHRADMHTCTNTSQINEMADAPEALADVLEALKCKFGVATSSGVMALYRGKLTK